MQRFPPCIKINPRRPNGLVAHAYTHDGVEMIRVRWILIHFTRRNERGVFPNWRGHVDQRCTGPFTERPDASIFRRNVTCSGAGIQSEPNGAVVLQNLPWIVRDRRIPRDAACFSDFFTRARPRPFCGGARFRRWPSGGGLPEVLGTHRPFHNVVGGVRCRTLPCWATKTIRDHDKVAVRTGTALIP